MADEIFVFFFKNSNVFGAQFYTNIYFQISLSVNENLKEDFCFVKKFNFCVQKFWPALTTLRSIPCSNGRKIHFKFCQQPK